MFKGPSSSDLWIPPIGLNWPPPPQWSPTRATSFVFGEFVIRKTGPPLSPLSEV